MPVGTNVTGKMVAALRRIGFEKVFDTDLAADMTIVEEAHEFVERALDGDTVAFEHLFNRYRDSIYQLYVQRTSGRTDDASDNRALPAPPEKNLPSFSSSFPAFFSFLTTNTSV